MATVNRRTFVGGAAALTAAAALPTRLFAHQEASPEAAEGAPSLLDGLGLPELAVTVTDAGFELEAEAAAGTTLLSVTNASAGFASFLLVQPPAEVSAEDVDAAIAPNSAMPEWLHQAVVTGSLDLAPGQSGQVVIALTAGEWYVVNVGEAPAKSTLTVSGEFVEVAIEAAVTVLMSHHRFEIPAEVSAGPQVWHVVNEDAVLHHMILFTYPQALTVDEVLALIMSSEGMATPPAGLDPAQLAPVGGIGLLSQGVSNWVEYNFPPGHYQAVCFIADPGAEVPHALDGMVATFSVA